MRQSHSLLLLTIVLMMGIVLDSCSEPTLVGSEIIDQTDIDFYIEDTVTINTTTVNGLVRRSHESSIVATLNQNFYLIGELDDPVFGKTKADFYSRFFYSTFPDSSSRATAVVDSVVMLFYPDSSRADGDINSSFELSVHRLTENIEEDTLSSDATFAYDPSPLASQTFSRYNLDSLTVYYNGDTIESRSQLRMQLPNSIGEEIISLDTSVLNSIADFAQVLPGFYITQSAGTAIMGSYQAPQMLIYYSHSDTVKATWSISSGSILYRKTNNFTHDHSGSMVDDFIGNGNTSDSIVFLQGMSGPMTKLSFPYINSIIDQNFIINKAELKIPINVVTEENNFDLPYVLSLSTLDDDNELVLIDEFQFAISNDNLALGGNVEDDYGAEVTINISRTFNEILNDDLPNELYLEVFQRNIGSGVRDFFSRKMVVNGNTHSTNPLKLTLHYSILE